MAVDYELIRRKRNLPQEVLEAAYETALSSLPLAALRTNMGLTQSVMAERLETSQAAVSKLEARGDFLISTLQRYVDAVGGNFDVVIRAADRCYRLVRDIDEDSAFYKLESCFGKQMLDWEALTQAQAPSSQKAAGLWTKRASGAEDVHVAAAFADSANENAWPEAA